MKAWRACECVYTLSMLSYNAATRRFQGHILVGGGHLLQTETHTAFDCAEGNVLVLSDFGVGVALEIALLDYATLLYGKLG